MKAPNFRVDRLTRGFAKRHGLELTHVLVRESVAIRATSSTLSALNEAYADQDESSLTDPAVGVLLNMLHRDFEHVEGAIVAFVTGSGASAEVIARTAVESSLAILYILAGNRKERMAGWFYHYISSVDGQIKNWRREILFLEQSSRMEHERALSQREQANNIMRDFVRALVGDSIEPWPKKIEERFRGVDEAVTYRTFYARLSAEPHADAEETLRHVFGKMTGLSEEVALETITFSRFLLYMAISFFLRACDSYAHAYSFVGARRILSQARADTDAELAELSVQVG